MRVFKFQTDSTGSEMLVYAEGKTKVGVIHDRDVIAEIVSRLKMAPTMGKAFAMADIKGSNVLLETGDALPDPGW